MGSGGSAASALLSVNNLEVVYDDVIQVLRGVSLTVPEGQIVALLGANGAGKTTLLLAVTGLLDVNDGEITKGSVVFDGQPIHRERPTKIVALGIKQVMEGRRVFAELTVDENLRIGGQWRPNGYARTSSGSTICSLCWRRTASAPPDTFPGVSSRCSRWVGHSCRNRAACCLMSRASASRL